MQLLKLIILVIICEFLQVSSAQGATDPVEKAWISKNENVYTLNINIKKGFDFNPLIFTPANGLKMFLTFKKPVEKPLLEHGSQGCLRGYFFEQIGDKSLMFIMSFNEDVKFLKKSYNKTSIKISFSITKKPTIVIDAGHGGKDPGTVSPYNKQSEKNITLVAALELRQALLNTGRYNVVLTRDADEFVSLEDRLKIINNAKGSFFISLHTDYNKDPSLSGLSVYTLPENALNSMENLSLYQSNLKLSRKFANILTKYVPRRCKIRNKTCRFGDWKILKNSSPAVLIELAYLSNKKDQVLLLTKSFRNKVVCAMVYALDEYFKSGQKL
ncbi:MAG: N-acetylmuramoyl-L-alanine amidase [Alphaproteobacteria bacterium]|nr:N-acetylmuramoyl-L-alanine amidase [Alphaproteobacteria bacterium]